MMNLISLNLLIPSFVIFFISYAHANSASRYKSLSDLDLESVSLDKSAVLTRRDSKTGLILNDYTVDKDRLRFSLLYHLNPDLSSPTAISTFEGVLAKKFSFGWVEAFASRTSATFSEITETNTKITPETQELRDSSDSLLSIGTGLSYRSSLMQELFTGVDKVYETTSASIAYHKFNQSLTSEDYSGFGIKTDFGIHYRSSPDFHWGGKMSYNIAHVNKAKADETQSSSETALLITWLTLAADITFYF